MMNKKEFQKVISKIRADRRIEENLPRTEYPKAMMTSSQMAKNTATVNCGGEWVALDTSKKTAARVMRDERFQKFLADNQATATVETFWVGSCRACQIRINY